MHQVSINRESIFSGFKSVRREILWVFLFFIALYALTNQGFLVGEGGYHYKVALQILQKGQLGFSDPVSGVFVVAPNGRYYAGHEIGNSLFMLPTAAFDLMLAHVLSGKVSEHNLNLLSSFILSFQFGVYSAITATGFFSILRTGYSIPFRQSVIATLSLGLTTFFWTYARNSYDGVLCCMLLTLSFLCLVLYKQQYNRARYGWFLAGTFLCLGFSFITRISMIIPIFTSLLYLALLHRRILKLLVQRVGFAIACLIPFGIWQMWYNHIRTGFLTKSPVQTEQYASNNALDGDILLGLSGLLFSPGKSLFVYAPLLIISVILSRKFYREHRREAVYSIVLAVLWFLLHARLRSWYGAWGWGPRHFLIVLPIFMLPFAVQIDYVFRVSWLRRLAGILASIGFILSACSIVSNWHFRMAYAREQGRLGDAIFVWGLKQNQAIDMLAAGFANLWRFVTGAAPITLPSDYSEANEYVSSTLNIWPNALIASGVPGYLAIAAALPVFILLVIAANQLILRLKQNFDIATVRGDVSK